MPTKGPKDWSPRPDPAEEFREIASELIGDLMNSGDSQSVAVGQVLASAYDDGELDEALAISILDEFIASATWAKGEIERMKREER